MAKEISPVAASQGKAIGIRCTCTVMSSGAGVPLKIDNPTCPVHGHGRPAGTGK